MALEGEEQWKEIIIVSDEEGREYVVSCGWGTEPPVAYIPSAADWPQRVPAWLHERRAEVVALLEAHCHRVDDTTP